MFIIVSKSRKIIYYKSYSGICVDGALWKFIDSSLITPQRVMKTLQYEMKTIKWWNQNWPTLLDKDQFIVEDSTFNIYTQGF